ncbi:MAG: hypothetical protein J3R72DRAFT_446511 [Linnemannia gamsii]|nr:MAG: hypothetical protein J3R72DRAFT_446511 [Linnemannia gamsii]
MSRYCVHNLSENEAQVLWRAIGRFEDLFYTGDDRQLGLSHLRTMDLDTDKEGRYSTPNQISFSIENTSHPEMHSRFFSRYRNLKSLSWCRSRSQFSMEGLAWHLEQQRWPQLEELYLSGVIASDQELATVVCRLPLSLKSFGLGSGDFGPLCFRHLQER